MDSLLVRAQIVISDYLGIPRHEITPEKDLYEDLGLDSLDTVELVMTLEDEFDIEIPEVAWDGIRTVDDLLRYLKNYPKTGA